MTLRGIAQTVRVPTCGRGGLAKLSYNFYGGLKSYGICGRRSLVETLYGGRGLAENVRIPSYGEGSKIAQKTVI